MKVPSEELTERMQSAGEGIFSGEAEDIEEEEIDLPGQLLPGGGLRLSNTPEDIPKLIAELRKMRGMTQAELGQAIGYPAQVIGNIEQGSRKLGLKTLKDLFNALGGDLYIEYRQK
ncbi:helix-turn-helix transcriptional regulator [Nibrella saemangeumensis]